MTTTLTATDIRRATLAVEALHEFVAARLGVTVEQARTLTAEHADSPFIQGLLATAADALAAMSGARAKPATLGFATMADARDYQADLAADGYAATLRWNGEDGASWMMWVEPVEAR